MATTDSAEETEASIFPFLSSTLPLPSTTERSRLDALQTKIVIVDFRSGEAVRSHPDLAPLLKQGWQIRSAAPRIVETAGASMMVVLTQPALTPFRRNLA